MVNFEEVDLDELKQKWAEHDRKLDLNIHLNRQLLLATNLNRVRSPLRRMAFFLGLEAAIGVVVAIVLGGFIHDNIGMARFVMPAVALHLWVIANIAAAIRMLAMALQIDYDKPIATIQKQLEGLRAVRIRVTQWALLTGQLVWWAPFMIVALKGFFGIDVYRFVGLKFVVVNLLFGVAVIPVAIWLSRKYGERVGRSPFMRRLMRDLAGYNLNAATGFLATISEFAEER
jgi:hypothetical protein